MKPIFNKILIANRGEIACRVIRTARRMGIATVAVYSDADAGSMHVAMADEAVRIGPAQASESYLDKAAVIDAALKTGAQAIHPGYGFLSENPDFVEAVQKAGLVFVGPSADAIRAMGLKDRAKQLMDEAGVPIVPGYHGENQGAAFLEAEAGKIGYPVLIKARAGGGGKGMRLVEKAEDFAAALASAAREGKNAFGDPAVLIEKYITSPRHIEVQVFGDNHGNVVHLLERDCSLQRRHQKVIEEAPAPGMTDEVRQAMTAAAVRAAAAISYSGAGTIEFIVDGSGALRTDGFWFMEMNTRLQVEHPVTELITGLDLVEWQLRVAAGETLPLAQDAIGIDGHAFEARLYAEDPANGFLPQTGTIRHLSFSGNARNDSGVRGGDAITPFYDPMIAKVIVHGEDRHEALGRLVSSLEETHVAGTITNAGFLAALARHEGFSKGEVDTGLIDRDIAALIEGETPGEAAFFVAASIALGIDHAKPLAGWRAWGEASHRVRLEIGDEVVERRIVLHGDGTASLICDGSAERYSDISHGDGWMRLRAGETQGLVEAGFATYTLPRGKAVSVKIAGHTHEIVLPDPLVAAAEAGDMGDEIRAPMTGTVAAVNVSAGDAVAKGDRLIVMEAMKMETALTAPRAGTVAEVLCTEGGSVEGGKVLVRLEAEDE